MAKQQSIERFKNFAKVNKVEIAKLIFIILASSVVAVYLAQWLQSDDIQSKIEQLGILGPILIIVYIVASHVIAPLVGTPGTLAAISIYGPVYGGLILYISSMLSATVNFFIARRFGRKWVRKLSGENTFAQVDKFTAIMGEKVLIIARLFGISIYEIVSYAAGFTSISFKKYFAITSTVSIIPGVIMIYLYSASISSPLLLSFVTAGMIILGLLFSVYIVWLYEKSN